MTARPHRDRGTCCNERMYPNRKPKPPCAHNRRTHGHAHRKAGALLILYLLPKQKLAQLAVTAGDAGVCKGSAA